MNALTILVLAASALFVQANVLDLVSKFGLKDKFAAELPHLKEIADAVLAGKEPKAIVQETLARHPELKQRLEQVCDFDLLEKISFVKTACDFLTVAPTQQRGLFGNIGNKFKQEFENLKQIASQITQGKSPIAFIKELAKKGATKALAKVCKISFAKKIPYVAKACAALEQAAPQIPAPVPEPEPEQSIEVPAPIEDEPAAPEVPEVPEVPVVEAPAVPEVAAPETPIAQRKFSFGSILNAVSNVPILGGEVSKIKNLVDTIKGTKDPLVIAKAVLDLGLQDKIVALCKLPLPIPGADVVCGVVNNVGNFQNILGSIGK